MARPPGWVRALALAFCLLATAPAFAGPLNIPLNNPSFESPLTSPPTLLPPGSGAFADTNSVPGWTVLGPGPDNRTPFPSAGVWAPSVGQFAPIPDGSQVAYTYFDGRLDQQTTATVRDTDYTLSAFVGRPLGVRFGDFICYTLQLWAGNEKFGDLSSFVDNLTDGTFTRLQLTARPEASQLGRPLSIRLGSIGGTSGLNHTGSFATFDDVRLSFDGPTVIPIDSHEVPEPATWLLVGVGLAVARRRRK